MLGEHGGLVAIDQALQPREMLAVERPGAADRERHAMQRQRIARAELGEQAMRRPALAHIVLGMHLEEAEAVVSPKHVVGMLGLEADADARAVKRLVIGSGRRDHALSSLRGDGPAGPAHLSASCETQLGRLIGSSEPLPNGVSMVVQVPLGTSFQEAPL